MKKLFLFLLVISIGLASEAQFGRAAAFQLSAGDTLTNTDTISKVITATAGYNAMGVQVLVNKLSGTLTGKAIIYQSLDGTNYQQTDSVTTFSTIPSWTGLTPTYTNSAYFQKVTVPGVYYKVSIISSGTVSAPIKVLYTLRKDVTQ